MLSTEPLTEKQKCTSSSLCRSADASLLGKDTAPRYVGKHVIRVNCIRGSKTALRIV